VPVELDSRLGSTYPTETVKVILAGLWLSHLSFLDFARRVARMARFWDSVRLVGLREGTLIFLANILAVHCVLDNHMSIECEKVGLCEFTETDSNCRNFSTI